MDYNLLKIIKYLKPSPYFRIVFGFWTIIGILTGTAYFGKSPPPDGIPNFYLRGFVLALIIAYLNVAEFPLILKAFKTLNKHAAKLWQKSIVYFFLCLCSLFILWFVRLTYSAIFFTGKELTYGYYIDAFTVFRILGYDGVFFFILNLFIIHTKEYYDLFKEGKLKAAQLELELMKSQLEALKIQIHPHFLFNTLHLIASLIREKDNDMALKMTTNLSHFLRYTLKNHSQDFVSLEQEMEMIYLYFRIQQIRFQDRLKVHYNIDEGAKEAKIPNMILQPLVENAIRHGISKRLEAGKIDIEIKRVNGSINITIQDDGPGINGAADLLQKGIGLKNTITRLEKCYKKNFKFDIANAEQTGAKIMMEIPFETSGGQN